jgi:tRNA threonylcarbamoyladenosine biosynthesis protein TsaE
MPTPGVWGPNNPLVSLRATIDLPAEPATELFGRALSRVMQSGDVVLLEGELGSGKTSLARAIASGLGIPASRVSSPTFVLMQMHEVPQPSSVRTLVHVDAYRLGGPGELDSIGWDRVYDAVEKCARPGHAIVIEWGDRVRSAIAGASLATAKLEHDPPGRSLQFQAPESWKGRPGLEALVMRPPTRCRVTGAWVAPDSPTYPFADERARLADLNRWFTGSYSIQRPIGTDEDSVESSDPSS